MIIREKDSRIKEEWDKRPKDIKTRESLNKKDKYGHVK